MFKIGDKVICINDLNQGNKTIKSKLYYFKKDNIYIIRGYSNNQGLLFEEIIIGYYYSDNEVGANPNRFKKIEKQDFGSLILENIKKQIKEEELVEVC